MMKEDLDIFCKDLGYEDGFGSSEVSSFIHRKQLIDTLSAVEAANNLEIKDIFNEDRESTHHFFPHGLFWHLQIMWLS